MTWGPTQVQKRIYEVLSADATLTGLVNGIYDHVPQEQDFPFITIGEAAYTDRGSYTTEGWTGTITINVWAQNYGRLQVQNINAEIDRLLHCQDLSMDGWSTLSLRRDFVEILVEDDNTTFHGIQRYIILMGDINNE